MYKKRLGRRLCKRVVRVVEGGLRGELREFTVRNATGPASDRTMTSSRTIHCSKEARSLTRRGSEVEQRSRGREREGERERESSGCMQFLWLSLGPPDGQLPRAVSLNTRGDNVVCTIPVSAGNDATVRETEREKERERQFTRVVAKPRELAALRQPGATPLP